MKNLELQFLDIQKIPHSFDKVQSVIQVDGEEFILSNGCVYLIKNDVKVVISDNDIHTLEWLPLERVIFMANGSCFNCYDVTTKQSIEILLDENYDAHAWNPTQDKIAIMGIDGLVRVLILNISQGIYTAFGTYNVYQDNENSFVSVGWGSVETQFRGSGERSATPVVDCPHRADDQMPRIVWRSDGEYFIIGYTVGINRRFKVFTHECDFMYDGSPVIGLCAPLAWRPDGSLIAGEQMLTRGRHNIIFFEKNGLVRDAFPLLNQTLIEKMEWNPSGDILMLWHRHKTHEHSHEISLWTTNNYKWYLKQNLMFTSANIVVNVKWIARKTLQVITAHNILIYCWHWVVHISRDRSFGALAVINGRTLQMTITIRSIVPPPMCTYSFNMSRPINFITFSPQSTYMGVVLDNGTFRLLKYGESQIIFNDNTTFNVSLINCDIPLSFHHFAFNFCKDTLLAAQSIDSGTAIFKFQNITKSFRCAELCSTTENVTSIFFIDKSETYVMHLSRTVSVWNDHQIKVCDDMPAGHLKVFQLDGKYHALCLTPEKICYLDNTQISRSFTSFLIINKFILFTTTTSKLICVRITERGLSKLRENDITNFYSRSIPTSGVLICAIPTTRKVILQVSRGDLETISPRVLSIEDIDTQMSMGNFLTAYRIMRTDRLNPNLLFDMNPQRFLDNMERIIKCIDNCQFIDIFLLQLQDKNVAESLYGSCFEEPLPEKPANKVIAIANGFIKTMEALDQKYYLQSIVTACACKNTDEGLEYALTLLHNVKRDEDKNKKDNSISNILIQGLIVITSVERLYEIALGMYQFEIISWIATKSNVDPLTYIPFMKDLSNMTENYRKYKINAHIKKFEKAFEFLIKCDDVDKEIEPFIRKHNLYNLILKYTTQSNQYYKTLMVHYSAHLSKEGHFDEAGMVLRKIGMFVPAFHEYLKSCNFPESIHTINQIDRTTGNEKLYLELVHKLVNNKLFKDASSVYEHYLKNPEQAVVMLTNGQFWTDALATALKYKRKDIVETNIKPELYTYMKNVKDSLVETQETIKKNALRLENLREKRIADRRQAPHLYGIDELEFSKTCDNDVGSIISTRPSTSASSIGSLKSSSRSSTSSRRKRRLEKKVIQVREGSVFEDVALMRNLYLSITEIQGYSLTVYETSKTLLSLDDYEEALEFYSFFKKLLNDVNSTYDMIWPKECMESSDSKSIEYQVLIQNFSHLELKYRLPPPPLTFTKIYFFE